MADLPKDPMILLSVVNTKLRDFYADLDTLCQEMQIEKKELTEKLASIDYEYDAGPVSYTHLTLPTILLV